MSQASRAVRRFPRCRSPDGEGAYLPQGTGVEAEERGEVITATSLVDTARSPGGGGALEHRGGAGKVKYRNETLRPEKKGRIVGKL